MNVDITLTKKNFAKLRHPFLAHLRPLPPVIMSSFDIPPPPHDDVIYVQDNPKIVKTQLNLNST